MPTTSNGRVACIAGHAVGHGERRRSSRMRRTPMRRRSVRSTPTVSARRHSSMCRAAHWRASTRCSHFATALASDVSRRRRPGEFGAFRRQLHFDVAQRDRQHGAFVRFENAERRRELGERRIGVDLSPRAENARHSRASARCRRRARAAVARERTAFSANGGLKTSSSTVATPPATGSGASVLPSAATMRVALANAAGTGALNCNRIGCSGIQPARALTRSHCTRAVNAGRTWNASF